MKYLITFFLLLSCAHHDHHGHDHHGLNHDTHETTKKSYSWKDELSNLKREKEVIEINITWLNTEIDRHSKSILTLNSSISKIKKNLANKNLSTLEKKKLRLKLINTEEILRDKHAHFKEDFSPVFKYIKMISTLKKEIESHEGHNH